MKKILIAGHESDAIFRDFEKIPAVDEINDRFRTFSHKRGFGKSASKPPKSNYAFTS